MRLVFLGSPPFATPVLERLAGSRFRPLLVVTQPARARGRGKKLSESPLSARARELGLEVLEPATVRDPEVLGRLAGLEPDLFLVVSYGELLRQEFLDLPRLGSLNVHPSLLPRHRGATPIQAALLAGDEVTGVSIQQVVLALDAGDVLLSRQVPVLPGETAGELSTRLSELSGELLLEALEALEAGRARFVPQDAAQATHCRKLKKEDGRLDWSRPAAELERRVRAMNPWPGAFTRLPDGRELLVWRARLAEPDAGLPPGTLRERAGGLVVAAGPAADAAPEGRESLELLEVQLSGKRPLSAAEFLRGARLSPGQRLGG